MSREEEARRLFEEWVGVLDSGERDVDPRELCRGRPELLGPLESLIDNYRLAEAIVGSPGPRGGSPGLDGPDGREGPVVDSPLPEQIGRYRVRRLLGRGGMGVVYAADDENLGRQVAIKTIVDASGGDERARRRLWREARAAARLQHPNICHVYEIGEDDSTLFIVMELLEGESLRDRLRRGPLPAREAIHIAIQVLAALEALHGRGLVHRDLKPSNVFLTAHAVKLLDFGLVRVDSNDPLLSLSGDESELTEAGALAGTPRYMAPEQLRGEGVDARSDLFALGAVMFEMMTGGPAFPGGTMLEISHQILYGQRPALGGSPVAAVVDRVVRRALASRPEDRWRGAGEMAAALTPATSAEQSGPIRVHTVARFMALPFRILRPDADTDFLAIGIPDAVTNSLAGVEALVVRSSAIGARFASDDLDFKRIAEEADVDVVLAGSILRSSEKMRVATQLVEVPAGTVLWSQERTITMGDVFELQDRIVERIVESLSLSLTAREHRLRGSDVPASATAYEFFLRANYLLLSQGVGSAENLSLARDLYERSIEEDPRYAPAWARLGRCHWLIGKGGEERGSNLAHAEECLQRALDLKSDLPLAHHLYALHDIDLGRPQEAMVRLVEKVLPGRADAEAYGALVTALRYCGLQEASVAAHERAERLDAQIRTSVAFTYRQLRDFDLALAYLRSDRRRGHSIADREVEALTLFEKGESQEALRIARQLSEEELTDFFRLAVDFEIALFEGRTSDVIEAGRRTLEEFHDAEGIYDAARALASVGEREMALRGFARCFDQGFTIYEGLTLDDPWLEPLLGEPRFEDLLRRGARRRSRAFAAFREAGGEQLLGIRTS